MKLRKTILAVSIAAVIALASIYPASADPEGGTEPGLTETSGTPTEIPDDPVTGDVSETPTPTEEQATETPTPTESPEASETPTPTSVPLSNTPTPTVKATDTPTPTMTPTNSPTPEPTKKPTPAVIAPGNMVYPSPKKKSDRAIDIKSTSVIKVDGIYESLWDEVEAIPIKNVSWGEKGATGSFKTYWDKTMLYILVEVEDDTPDTAAEKFSRKDCVEIFLDETGTRPEAYGVGTYHYKISRSSELELGNGGDASYLKYAVIDDVKSYKVEIGINFVELVPVYGSFLGIDIRVNDSQNDQYRDYMTQWSDTSMYTFENLSKIGILYLK